jgi:hypothetical protein
MEGACDKKFGLKKCLITDEQMLKIKLRGDKFHKDWNYTVQPSARNM